MESLVSYAIDADDLIVAVGDDWVSFAEHNQAPELGRRVIGTSLWGYLNGPTTRAVYGVLVARVRSRRAVSFHFRCDSPTMRRDMKMTMTPALSGTVEFVSIIERQSTRRREPSGRMPEPPELLRMCSWCKRVYADAQWVEPEDAIEPLGLFIDGSEPWITHGICPICAEKLDVEDVTLEDFLP